MCRSVLTAKTRWCTVSDPEHRKCAELAKALLAVLPPAALAAFGRLSCIRASSTTDCIDRIRVSRPAKISYWDQQELNSSAADNLCLRETELTS